MTSKMLFEGKVARPKPHSLKRRTRTKTTRRRKTKISLRTMTITTGVTTMTIQTTTSTSLYWSKTPKEPGSNLSIRKRKLALRHRRHPRLLGANLRRVEENQRKLAKTIESLTENADTLDRLQKSGCIPKLAQLIEITWREDNDDDNQIGYLGFDAERGSKRAGVINVDLLYESVACNGRTRAAALRAIRNLCVASKSYQQQAATCHASWVLCEIATSRHGSGKDVCLPLLCSCVSASSGERKVGKTRHLRHARLRHRSRRQLRTQNPRFTSLRRLAQRGTLGNRSAFTHRGTPWTSWSSPLRFPGKTKATSTAKAHSTRSRI